MPQNPLFATYTQAQAILKGGAWFVNESVGSDSYGGTSAKPFATLAKAVASASAGDTIYLTGTVHISSTLAWPLNDVSLVGLNAPSNNSRARISSTGTAAFSPLVNVTGAGNKFIGFGTFHGGFTGATGSQVAWLDAGGRNYYSHVQFFGGGDTTTAALAGMRSLVVSGANGENLFEDCTVGLDTVLRATAVNASLEFTSGSPRNVFRRCIFQMYTSLATEVHVTAASTGVDRYALLDECVFFNAVNSTGTTINADITASSSAATRPPMPAPITVTRGVVNKGGGIWARLRKNLVDLSVYII